MKEIKLTPEMEAQLRAAAPDTPEARALADKVREAAEKAKAEGTMSGTTKPAGPVGRPPGSPSIGAVLSALHQLLASLGTTVDECDAHFIQNPIRMTVAGENPSPRAMSEEETKKLLARRHAVVIFRQIRDGAQAIMDACGPGPQPF